MMSNFVPYLSKTEGKACEICRDLQPDQFDEAKGRRGDVQRYLHFYKCQVRESADAGCRGCRLIIHAGDQYCIKFDFDNGLETIDVEYRTASFPLYITYHEVIAEVAGDFKLDLYTLESAEPSRRWPGIGVARHIHKDALSDPALELASTWLKECITTHNHCTNARDVQLPTRIIDVGLDTEQPRLIESFGSRGQYATLSHCWGKASLITTTISSLKQRKLGIPLADMPKTFQDAVRVTRQLRIKYLWIDSLCIIQDSDVDWKGESSRMQHVYADALVNIAANDAHDSTIGLNSSKRLPSDGKPVGQTAELEYIYVRQSRNLTDTSGVSHMVGNNLWRQVLSTRAWVLQENLLSPRILHFSASELAFECDDGVRCECTIGPRRGQRSRFREILTQHHSRQSRSADVWSYLVHEYSRRSLTYATDKLNAILALASVVAREESKTYLAGLWKEDLPWCLLWYCCPVLKTGSRQAQYFPSWSWASTFGCSIKYPSIKEHGDNTECKYRLQVKYAPFADEKVINFEEPQSGSMELRGYLAKIDLWDLIQETSLYDEVNSNLLWPDIGDYSEFKSDNCYILACGFNDKPLNNFLILRISDLDLKSEKYRTCYQRIGFYYNFSSLNGFAKAFENTCQEVDIALI